MNALEIISMFVDRINAHDVDGMCTLMEENHLFIDGLGNSVTGLEAIQKAWQAYFAMVPDYWIRVEVLLHQDSVVGIFGKAGGTIATSDGRLDAANRWEVPAAWQATVVDGRVAAWQVFADNESARRIIDKLAMEKAASQRGQSDNAAQEKHG